MHELDRVDPLHERKVLIDRMFSRDRAPLVAEPSERHMRTKRPFIRRPKGLMQGRMELRDLLAGSALRPQKARASWLRTIADMPECQSEREEPIGHAAKLLDCVRRRKLIP